MTLSKELRERLEPPRVTISRWKNSWFWEKFVADTWPAATGVVDRNETQQTIGRQE